MPARQSKSPQYNSGEIKNRMAAFSPVTTDLELTNCDDNFLLFTYWAHKSEEERNSLMAEDSALRARLRGAMEAYNAFRLPRNGRKRMRS